MKKKTLFQEMGRPDIKNPVKGYDCCRTQCDSAGNMLCVQKCGSDPEALETQRLVWVASEHDSKYEDYFGI